MRRIPFPANSKGVWQNLTRARSYLHSGLGRADLTVPLRFPIPTLPNPVTPKAFIESMTTVFQTLSGCRSTKPASRPEAGDLRHQQRRTKLGQWEYLTWDDYIGASKRSKEYNRYLADGIIRNLAASKSRRQRTFDRPGWRGLGVVDPAARQRLRQQAFRPRAQRSDECTVARPMGGTSPCPGCDIPSGTITLTVDSGRQAYRVGDRRRRQWCAAAGQRRLVRLGGAVREAGRGPDARRWRVPTRVGATPPTVYCRPLGIPVRWSRSSNCSRRRGGRQGGRPGALPRPASARARRRRHPLAFALVCPR